MSPSLDIDKVEKHRRIDAIHARSNGTMRALPGTFRELTFVGMLLQHGVGVDVNVLGNRRCGQARARTTSTIFSTSRLYSLLMHWHDTIVGSEA